MDDPAEKPRRGPGRPKGSFGPGRPRGSLTFRTIEIAARAARMGITPLEYMLAIVRNPQALPERRDRMAIAAAPYIHPRLAVMTVQGNPDAPLVTVQLDATRPRPEQFLAEWQPREEPPQVSTLVEGCVDAAADAAAGVDRTVH